MLYNIDKKKIRDCVDCCDCPYFDEAEKNCNGIGKGCFEIDETTMTIIDPVTKLPLREIPNKN